MLKDIRRSAVDAQQTVNAKDFESYLATDWQVIPLYAWDSTSNGKPDGKRPRHFDWTRRKYVSGDVIDDCIAHDWNMGVRPTARQLVIDVDPRNDGDVGFANLCLDLSLDPSLWPRVETGSGGSHYYLLLPEDVRVVDTLDSYQGVEFKSVGRQVVAAGSIHPGTWEHYRWVSNGHPALADAPEAPAALVTAIRRAERTGEAMGGGQYTPEQIATALAGLDVTEFRDHEKWIKFMMACHHASNGDARAEFIDWSTSDPTYSRDAEMIGRRWDSLHTDKAGAITYLTLNKILADRGLANLQAPPLDAADDFEIVEGDAQLERKPANGLTYQVAKDIEPREIEWVWPHRFAVGKLGIIAGFPAKGKSQVTVNIAATVSNGGEWPNTEGRAVQGAVVVLSAEDEAADTIVPRLIAAGADLDQVIIVNAIVRTDRGTRVFNLAEDLGALATVLDTERGLGRAVRLIIIDPISAYMGGKTKADSHNNAEVRALLTPLVEWAARHRAAVIAISHFNKSGNGNALYRVTDSLAFTAAARTVWLTLDEPGTGRFLFLKGKSNIAADPGGLTYKIEGVPIPGGIVAPRIVWEGRTDTTADEALGEAGKSKQPSVVDAAEEFLLSLLLDGPLLKTQIDERTRETGHSEDSIRQAKARLAVKSTRVGGVGSGGNWYWSLPKHVDA